MFIPTARLKHETSCTRLEERSVLPSTLILPVAITQQNCRWLVTAVTVPLVASTWIIVVFLELIPADKHRPPGMDALIISQQQMPREEHMDVRSINHHFPAALPQRSVARGFSATELEYFVSHSPRWIILEIC